MAHFRKITVDEVKYEYRATSSNVFIWRKESGIHHSVQSEKVSKPFRYCEDCRCDCGTENLPTRIAVTPRKVADYIRKQEFHKPLQSKPSPELIRIRPKKKKPSEMTLLELIQEIVNMEKREKREKILKEKRRLQKKNKTAPKKKASSNGKEWVELKQAKKRRGLEDLLKNRLTNSRTI